METSDFEKLLRGSRAQFRRHSLPDQNQDRRLQERAASEATASQRLQRGQSTQSRLAWTNPAVPEVR
jgi:hypothetical protein